MTEDHISELARSYIACRGITMGTLCQHSYASFDFGRLDRGGSLTVRNYHRLVQWFSDHWPDDLDWPRDIVRPAVQQEAA